MDIHHYCLSKYGAEATLPFGPSPVCFKVGGKIFAQLYAEKLTLKCTLSQGELFRSLWPEMVVRGYHCPPVQQPYWNTFDLSRFPEAELPGMIDLAYRAVLDSFSKRKRAQILGPMGTTVTVQVDRPLGSCHPNHPDIYYSVNYGFIPGIMAPDGEEQDAYLLGIDHPTNRFTGTVIAVIHREDDCEDKWVVAPEGMTFSPTQILDAVHFQEQYFRTRILTL
ncbi:MAG: MmcQ/YjbR family DNA-binding protein [Oscillospiraceae bacterium]|nr:MmcQ/YjbR family DNA-binding protein [Oscillospiraceae bacterium]